MLGLLSYETSEVEKAEYAVIQGLESVELWLAGVVVVGQEPG